MRALILFAIAIVAIGAVICIATYISHRAAPRYDPTRAIRRRLPLGLRTTLVSAYDRRFRRQGRRHQGAR